MNAITVLNIFFRWLHITAACLAVGGAFFIRIALPLALRTLDPENAQGVFLRARRAFKMIVHPVILALLLSGAYNAWRSWHWYGQNPPLMHSLFGMHLLLGLSVITISLIVLSGREPIRSHRALMKLNLLLMALTILAGATVKWGRETEMVKAPGPRPAPSIETTR